MALQFKQAKLLGTFLVLLALAWLQPAQEQFAPQAAGGEPPNLRLWKTIVLSPLLDQYFSSTEG